MATSKMCIIGVLFSVSRSFLMSHFALKRNLVTRKCWPGNRDYMVNFQCVSQRCRDPGKWSQPAIASAPQLTRVATVTVIFRNMDR